MSLKKQTINGVIWTVGQQFSGQLITASLQVVLARFLKPESFGLIAMLSIFMALGKTLVDSGLTQSLIRNTTTTQRDLSTVFYMNMVMSALIYVIIYVCAPAISLFYSQPELTSILRIYAISFIIQGLVSVQTTILTKEMNFRLQFMMELPSIIVGSVVGLWMAYNGYGVWSLVWLYLSRTIVWTILHWLFAKWKPALLFDWDRFKYHYGFGYKLMISGVIDTIFQNIYTIVIGKFFSAASLGYYDRAKTYKDLPLNTLGSALGKVTYPMFAGLKDDKVKLKSAYKKVMQLVVFVICPLMIWLAVVAEPAFRWVLTEKWLPAVPYFQILCIAGILYPVHVYNLNILKLTGQSGIYLKLEIYKKALVVIFVAAAIPFGIMGLVIMQIPLTILGFLINSHYSGKAINYKTGEQVSDLSPIFMLAATSGLATYYILFLLQREIKLPDYLVLAVAGFLFAAFYLILCLISKNEAFFEAKNIILKKK